MNAFISTPLPCASSTRQAAHASQRTTPRCSAVTRRTALRLAGLSACAALLPQSVKAESLNEKKVIAKMDKITLAIDKAKSLKSVVGQWKDAFAEDDGLYVLRYIPIWLEPGRVAMADIASQTDVNIGDREKANQYAAAILGHLFELKTEARGRSKEGVLRELDEFVETADEFLAIPELKKLQKGKK